MTRLMCSFLLMSLTMVAVGCGGAVDEVAPSKGGAPLVSEDVKNEQMKKAMQMGSADPNSPDAKKAMSPDGK